MRVFEQIFKFDSISAVQLAEEKNLMFVTNDTSRTKTASTISTESTIVHEDPVAAVRPLNYFPVSLQPSIREKKEPEESAKDDETELGIS